MTMQKKSATIDGVAYEVSTLDAYSAVPVWHKVARVLVPAVKALVMGGRDLTDPAELGALAFDAGAIAVERMDPVDLRFCIDRFAEATTVTLDSGKSPSLKQVFADHFAGNLVSMAKWFRFCLEVNFGDFLDGARAMWRLAQQSKPATDGAKAETATSTSPSPETSTP